MGDRCRLTGLEKLTYMKKLLAVIALLLGQVAMYAQDLNTPLFRGELAEKYTYRLTGCVYAYSDEFEMGDVMFNGKPYSGLMMNLNSHRGELQVRVGESGECVVLKQTLVGDFNIGDRKYTNLYGATSIKGLADGYYQVIHRGKDILLKKIYKSVSDKADFITGEITKSFTTRYRYYLVKDGKVNTIKDGNSLVKFYKEYKAGIRQFIKENRIPGGEEDFILEGIMDLVSK